MRPLRVLVYPHTTEIGGSQLNAIELAAAVRDRGNWVGVYAADGPLIDYVRDLGLVHIEARRSRITPGPATARDLNRLVGSEGIDVVHGYEWPPILEAYAACQPIRHAVAVGTVMSMSVAPFIPRCVPLTVGTARIQHVAGRRHRAPVHLLEPPVDTRRNRPHLSDGEFHATHPAAPGTAQVVVVSRLVRELKLEGILTTIEAVGALAASRLVRLVVVGDGSARDTVASAAARVNESVGREVVLLTGELNDPRAAYDSADVCIGMGGSALRAMSFGKPLVVQGESGFFQLLTRDNVDFFLEQGFYGRGDQDPASAARRLAQMLGELIDDPARSAELGRFGRSLVEERFSLERAAEVQEEVYRDAMHRRTRLSTHVLDSARSGAGLVSYKVHRRVDRWRGRLAVDDFNARPV